MGGRRGGWLLIAPPPLDHRPAGMPCTGGRRASVVILLPAAYSNVIQPHQGVIAKSVERGDASTTGNDGTGRSAAPSGCSGRRRNN